MTKFLAFLFILIAICFAFYSYGFVDFNLTLSSHPWVTNFVSWTQSLAMYRRPLSLNVYLSLIALMYLVYIISLNLFTKSGKFPWKFIIILGLIFTFAYPLLSSDSFKYLFSAKMVIEYGANPHVLPPNTFPDDPWIRFMRWVHTPSPYGPVMTSLAILPFVISFGKFVPSLYMLKIISLVCYLLSIWLIGKLAEVILRDKKWVLVSQLFFALNPLILIEWLTNVHNDGPMITILLLALYLFFKNKKLGSFITLFVSVGIKYVTIVLLPILFLRKLNPKIIVYYLLLTFFAAPLIYHYTIQYQPWYVTWLIPFAGLTGSLPVMSVVGAYTLGSFLRYIPFISTGLWTGTPIQFALYSFLPPTIVIIFFAIRYFTYNPRDGK